MKENNAARRLFVQESFGVLSTISLDVPGYPFGSITPYSTDRQGRPIIYISHIAQHTQNILADSRVSLTVFDTSADSDDVQARGRVTCIGDARALDADDSDVSDVGERYFRYFPSARQYEHTHSFQFFRLDLVRVRFIGGFGKIFWVEPGEFLAGNPFSASQESRIIQHMNDDHRDALMQYTGGKPAVMAGIDAEGFDVLQSGNKARFDFDAPISTMDEARQALIAMLKRPA
jgi:putative heme iron utilization protein